MPVDRDAIPEGGDIGSSRLAVGGSIESVANFDEQTFATHPAQVTAGNTDVREIARSHYPSLSDKRDRAIPKRWRRPACEA